MSTYRPKCSIPVGRDDVTPGWVTEALQEAHPGVEVSSVSIETLHDGTALTCRLRLEYTSTNVGPPTVCLKAGIDAPHRELLFQTGLFSKEAMVYADLLPRVGARVPVCFAARGDSASGRGFVLIEDLGERGARFCAADDQFTVNEAADGLEQLAALHAAMWSSPDAEAPIWRHRGYGLGEADPAEGYMRSMIPKVLQTPHGGAVVELLKDPEILGEAIVRLRSLDHAAANCLIHGDAHVGNVYRDRNGGIGLADFQCVQRGHFSHDVALFVASSLDPLDRRSNERELVRHHLSSLERLGVEAPSFEEAWLGYRRHVLYGLWAWLLTTERYQTERRLVACVFRFGLASLDLDSLEALA